MRTVSFSRPQLPSFFVVGPPRTGTTWLHNVLSEHTNLPDPAVETRFFDVHFHRGLNWYFKQFARMKPGYPMGEVAPSYFGSSDARNRIRRLIPGAKLIFIFRHPVQRILSLYRLKCAQGLCAPNLDKALEQDRELMESSLYATNLRKWQSCFSPNQLSIHLYEDMKEQPQAFIARICDFLDIPRFHLRRSQIRQVISPTQMTEPRIRLVVSATDGSPGERGSVLVDAGAAATGRNDSRMMNPALPDIPDRILQKIWTQVLSEIEDLERILERDLSYWKTPAAAHVRGHVA